MTEEEIIDMVMQIGGCDRPEHDSPALKMFVTFAKLVAEKAIKEALEKSVECMCGICKLGHQRTWIGLTQEERLHFLNEILNYGTGFVSPLDAVICNIETNLKYKNTRGLA